MALGKWKMFGSYFRAYSSEAYEDTMRAVENLAGSSLALLNNKPQEERRAILSKAESLTEKVFDAVETETPLVVALALMAALCAHERLIQEQAKQNKERNK
jgi:hypothetical protein